MGRLGEFRARDSGFRTLAEVRRQRCFGDSGQLGLESHRSEYRWKIR